MSEAYWQAKIWGILHDPALKALHNNRGRGDNSCWQELAVMQSWRENGWNPEESNGKLLEHLHLADFIASASDRAAIGSLSTSVNYASPNRDRGLEITHLLSGEPQDFKLNDLHHQELVKASPRADHLHRIEQGLFNLQIVDPVDKQLKTIKQIQSPEKLFWWLWRCLPNAVCNAFGNDESLLLMPAETRIPDGSIWSHASLTAAIAGALAGYDLTADDIKQRWSSGKTLSHAYLTTFSFSPIQELIKASRKMRDLWAGSWVLHYLSAKVCWAIAWKYGPDCILYPSLFQQPLIDRWLLQKWSDFQPWIDPPSDRQLLTAGFPNVLVLILPKNKVRAAMQMAEETLKAEWLKLGSLVFQELQEQRHWMPGLTEDSKTWKGWLQSQWQAYWSAIPLGKEGEELKSAAIPTEREPEFQAWVEAQNQAYQVGERQRLFQAAELDFLRQAYDYRLETQGRKLRDVRLKIA